tara:strand:+ start:35 stop:577 length:543 start_codon:yes stop_codon:yes gene_type:complete
MEIVIYFCLIFLFLWLLINNYNKIEGMECNLGTNFKKKSPDEIKSLSGTQKTLYECQVGKYNDKTNDPTFLKMALRNTEKLIPIIRKPIASIEKTFNELKDTHVKWKKTKKTRDDAMDKLYDFVDGKKTSGDNDHCKKSPASCEEIDTCKLDKKLCKGQAEVVKNNGEDGKPMATSFENE